MLVVGCSFTKKVTNVACIFDAIHGIYMLLNLGMLKLLVESIQVASDVVCVAKFAENLIYIHIDKKTIQTYFSCKQ